MLNNLTLAEIFRSNFKSLGRDIPLGDTTIINFSTDVGNVSQLVPTIQPLVAIAPDDILIHSPRFAEAAASEAALDCLLDAARAMTMTAVDLLADPKTMEKVRDDFRNRREDKSR